MAAYLIVNIAVRDQDAFNAYGQLVRPVVEQFGGRYLVRGGEIHHLEGDFKLQRLVVLEFPSMEAAHRFYDSPEYAPLLRMRLDSTVSDMVLVEGYAPSP